MKRILLLTALSVLAFTVSCSPAAQTLSEVSGTSEAEDSTSGESVYSNEASGNISS
jgi:hypothetical protein